MEEELARIEEEERETKVRIKRTDRKAMAKVIITSFVHRVALVGDLAHVSDSANYCSF